MTSKTKNTTSKSSKKDEVWKRHDTYDQQISFGRIVTRSQTAFCRIKNDDNDLALFADKSRHQPPGKPHLMSVLKGGYGSVPRTIVTRSTGKYLEENKDLSKALDEYKNYSPTEKEKELASELENAASKPEGSEPKQEAEEPEPKEAELTPKEEPKPQEETKPKEEPKPTEAETTPKEEPKPTEAETTPKEQPKPTEAETTPKEEPKPT